MGPKGERVDVTADNNSAIQLAAANGHTEVVKLLLAWVSPKGERVDITARDNYAIRYAAANGHSEAMELLKNWKSPPQTPSQTTDKLEYTVDKSDCFVGESEVMVTLKIPKKVFQQATGLVVAFK